jgi:protoheme ferro-lyase
MSYRDDLTEGLRIIGLDSETLETAEQIMDEIAEQCAHIARTAYVDCPPEHQLIVDAVQETIANAITRRMVR